MEFHCVRMGSGRPLLLLHGLGGSWRSWCTILPLLRPHRDVIAVDLPGFGDTPPLGRPTSIPSLADAVTEFLGPQGLFGVDVVGSSMGGRLALELARRGVTGSTVALAPGGFWRGWERRYFHRTIWTSVRLVRQLGRTMPRSFAALCHTPVGRTLLCSQVSARPWALDGSAVEDEMQSYLRARCFDELLASLVSLPEQEGAPAGSLHKPLSIVWGRQDRVCLPAQAGRASALFPDARLHWFNHCGHLPQWDQPEATAELILEGTQTK